MGLSAIHQFCSLEVDYEWFKAVWAYQWFPIEFMNLIWCGFDSKDDNEIFLNGVNRGRIGSTDVKLFDRGRKLIFRGFWKFRA